MPNPLFTALCSEQHGTAIAIQWYQYRDKHINTSVWHLFSYKNQHADCIKRTDYNIEASS
jgi:hypothetical protein